MTTPYYEDDSCTIFHGDCRDILPTLNLEQASVTIADPPYGDTSLDWDKQVDGWLDVLPTDNLWCFGSFRSFMTYPFPGWTLAQEIVWEKHNGSAFHADRFKRVHELAVQFYKGSWDSVYKEPVMVQEATAKTVRHKTRPTHTGHVEESAYRSEDGGPKLMRSVIQVPSCHGYAVHPTQKPLGIIIPLLNYSCPPGGLVVDPFMGSGSVLVAAKSLGMRSIGIELEEKYCDLAALRCSQGVLSL